MKTNKNIATSAGILFILAAVAAIMGALLYNPILHDPDYIINGTAHETQILWGAFFEIITAFAVIGTPIALYPVLKKYNQSMAIATVSFRLLEASMIIVGILSLLTIVTLNHEFSKGVNPDTASYLIVGKSLIALHNWTFAFGPNIALGPSTFMTSYLLFKSKLVPRFITNLGLVGGPFIFASGVMVMFGIFLQISMWGVLLAIPVFLYEMSLAVWLLVKGFKTDEVETVTVMR
jgi:Domain of unknown function (DUF4386)